jgi:hypothetical protein
MDSMYEAAGAMFAIIGVADRAPGIRHTARGVLCDLTCVVETGERIQGFSATLGWAHYRALMAVENRAERLFYEIEAEKDGCTCEAPSLERMMASHLTMKA